MSKNRKYENIRSLTILLSFSWLHFSSLLVFILKLSKRGCNGGAKEETYFALGIIRVFVHACEACCGHSNIDFARRM
jgi:hypothetical protein